MSDPAKILYLTGQRKRKMLGWVQDEKEAGGVKCFKIRKRRKVVWINEKDVVNVEAKTEAGKSSLDGNEGRDEAAPKIATEKEAQEFMEFCFKIANAGYEDCEDFQKQREATSGIRQDEPPMASGETLRVRGDGSGGSGDLFDGEPSGRRSEPQERKNGETPERSEVLHGGMLNRTPLDSRSSGGSVENGIAPAELERDRPQLEAWKKRVMRAAKSGKSLAEFKENFYARALANDTRFFIRFGKALESSKKKHSKKRGVL